MNNTSSYIEGVYYPPQHLLQLNYPELHLNTNNQSLNSIDSSESVYPIYPNIQSLNSSEEVYQPLYPSLEEVYQPLYPSIQPQQQAKSESVAEKFFDNLTKFLIKSGLKSTIPQPMYAPSAPLWEEFDHSNSEVENLNPPLPLNPQEQTVKTSVKLTVNSPLLPRLSYIDLAFPEVAQVNQYHDLCRILPIYALKDVIRHVFYYGSSIDGKAEKIVFNYFQAMPNSALMSAFNDMSNTPFSIHPQGIRSIEAAEALINAFYRLPLINPMDYEKSSERYFEACENLTKKFTTLILEIGPTSLFYKYVYEMAAAAKIEIESWDHQFASNNWNKPAMRQLSIQALQRCLHGQK